MDGRISADSSSVQLSWVGATPPRTGYAVASRRLLGQSGPESWEVIAPNLGSTMSFADTTTAPGVAYEYRLHRADIRDGTAIDVGYWATGQQVPAEEFRGTAIMVIDETLAEQLALRLRRFELDLIGDGWRVVRHLTARGVPNDPVETLWRARTLRAWIKEQYAKQPSDTHALILIGHVPLVTSGRSAPDGHEAGPRATDLFYADVDGIWPENDAGVLKPNSVPSDHIEMQVGRIDFSNLADGNQETEIRILQDYFDKNHHWRHGALGDLRDAYAGSDHLMVETNGLRNIVGPDAVVEGSHHDVGEEHRRLLGVDFGDWKGSNYAGYRPKSIFTINFGSGKLNIERPNNAISGLLAAPWYPITSGWGGRPSWYLHPMSLGKSIGYSHLKTVNNGRKMQAYPDAMEYYPTGRYVWRNPVWVNLLGDPTARPFPLLPPTNARAKATETGLEIAWDPSKSEGVTGYKLYRAKAQDASFDALNDGDLITGTKFVDTAAAPESWYMIRAYGLQEVNAGSFYTLSQGVFVRPGSTPVVAIDQVITVPDGLPLRVTPEGIGGDLSDGPVVTFVAGPDRGSLEQVDGNWIFKPADDTSWPVSLRFSVYGGLSSDFGTIELRNSRQ